MTRVRAHRKRPDAALAVFSVAHDGRLERIAETPARTMDGMWAKARAVLAFYDPDPPEMDSVAGPALWSLIRDFSGVAS